MKPEDLEASVNTDSLFSTVMVGPDAVRRVTEELAGDIARLGERIGRARDSHLFLVGGGASLAAMMGANYLLSRFTTLRSDVYTGWEFLNRSPLGLNRNSVVIGTSYSGETPEVRETLSVARSMGATDVAVTNTKDTLLAQDAGLTLDYQSKAVYTAPLAMMYLLCAHIMKARGESIDTADRIIRELGTLPERLVRLTEKTRPAARELARQFAESRGFYVLAAGPLYGLGYKLALSVVIENLWLDACPINTGEFYHGPIEIVPPKPGGEHSMDIMHLVGSDSSRPVSERALTFCRSRGARSLVFDANDYPGFGELFSPFSLFVPTEWFIMYMAAYRRHDVDERRYMGKIGARWGEY